MRFLRYKALKSVMGPGRAGSGRKYSDFSLKYERTRSARCARSLVMRHVKCKRRFDLIMRKSECVHIFNRLVVFTARLDLYLFHFAYKNVCFFVIFHWRWSHWWLKPVWINISFNFRSAQFYIKSGKKTTYARWKLMERTRHVKTRSTVLQRSLYL